MRTFVVDHPLVAHKLTVLRDKNTPSPVFRQLTEELVTLLAYEATRDVRTEPVTIETDQAPHAFVPSRQSDYSAQLQPRTVVRSPAPVYGGGGVWAPMPPYWYGPGWWGPGWYGPSVGVYVGGGPRYYRPGWGYGRYRRW